jgi:AcrR family transcriptional regulator
MARPRSEQANRAALDATVEILIERGVEGTTWEEVAARSGVAKSTLYRHFQTREDLVAQAIRSCRIDYPTPDTGSLDEDLRELFTVNATKREEVLLNQLMPVIVEGAARGSIDDDLMDEIVEARSRPIKTVLQLAQLRGEVSPDLDLDDAFALIIGPFTYQRIVRRQPVDDDFKETVLAWAIGALHATAPSSTPKPKPTETAAAAAR